jgi:hypothetical protein
MIARKVLFREANAEPNRHIFSKHDQVSSCFKSADCLRSLRAATPDSPLKMTMRNYRQISIAMSKRHMPNLMKPFDPHTPNDLDGFLRLLSFQTGHKPSTHVGAYALERGFPSKLQPDLIHRYIENSDTWQRFLMVCKDDYLESEIPSNIIAGTPFLERDRITLGTACDNDTDVPVRVIEHRTQAREIIRSRKRRAEGPLSPTSSKIRNLQRDLETLIAREKLRDDGWKQS